jgi:hypothetical protein
MGLKLIQSLDFPSKIISGLLLKILIWESNPEAVVPTLQWFTIMICIFSVGKMTTTIS